LVGTNCYISRAGQCWCYSQVEGNDGVTSCSTGEVGSISTSSIDDLSVPGVRQQIGTNGRVGRASQSRIDGQVQGDDGVTSCNTGEVGGISSSSIDDLSVPAVGQLIGTDGRVGRASQSRVDGQVQCGD